MATYIVTGHPLNYADLGLGANTDLVRAALMANGVGQTVTLVLSGPEDAKVKGHGALK